MKKSRTFKSDNTVLKVFKDNIRKLSKYDYKKIMSDIETVYIPKILKGLKSAKGVNKESITSKIHWELESKYLTKAKRNTLRLPLIDIMAKKLADNLTTRCTNKLKSIARASDDISMIMTTPMSSKNYMGHPVVKIYKNLPIEEILLRNSRETQAAISHADGVAKRWRKISELKGLPVSSIVSMEGIFLESPATVTPEAPKATTGRTSTSTRTTKGKTSIRRPASKTSPKVTDITNKKPKKPKGPKGGPGRPLARVTKKRTPRGPNRKK